MDDKRPRWFGERPRHQRFRGLDEIIRFHPQDKEQRVMQVMNEQMEAEDLGQNGKHADASDGTCRWSTFQNPKANKTIRNPGS